MSADAREQTLSVRFARLERRGVLLGLTGGQLSVLGAAALILGLFEFTAGLPGVVGSAPVCVPMILLGVMSVGGRTVVAWVPLLADWTVRGWAGGAIHLTQPQSNSSNRLVLPGVPSHLTVVDAPEVGAALVVDAKSGTVTAVVEVAGRGFALDDPGVQERLVAGWGRALAWTCQQPSVVRLQILHRVGPGGAVGVRRWWARNTVSGGSWAADIVSDLLTDAAQSTDRHETFAVLSVKAPRGLRGHVPYRQMTAIERQLAAFRDSLAGADLDVIGWVDSARLSRLLRAAYDPAGALVQEDNGPGDGDRWQAGPPAMGLVEEWDRIRTDSAWHATYWISEWPRSDVHPAFLQPLLLAPGVHRCLSIVAEPVSPERAMRDIRKAKVEHAADAAQRVRMGQLEDEATRAEADDILRREQELVAGHGDLRFVGLLTVSAATSEELDAACASLEAAAARSMCDLRRLVGQQALAHAAASLPLARRVT